MVQIRRRADWQRGKTHTSNPSSNSSNSNGLHTCMNPHIKAFLKTVALSAIIPLLFVLRASLQHHQQHQYQHWWSMPSLRFTNNKNNNPDDPYVAYLQQFAQAQQQLTEWPVMGTVVELGYCSIENLNWTQFVQQVEGPLLNATLQEYFKQQPKFLPEQFTSTTTGTSTSSSSIGTSTSSSSVAREFLLQLLEQYLQLSPPDGRCDYSRYRPTVPPSAVAQRNHGRSSSLPSVCPIVAIISAFRDAPQVSALLHALDHADTCLVVHLEDTVYDDNDNDDNSHPDFRTLVQESLDGLLHNKQKALLIQFGAVVYRTDTLSQINLRILRWLTDTVPQYQYVMLLDASAFPLVSPSELVQRLLRLHHPDDNQQPRRHVWLGSLTHQGANATGTAWDFRLQRKRLIATTTPPPQQQPHLQKWSGRLPRDAWGTVEIPERIRRHMIYKSTSGNQAIYGREVVQALLNSDTVMELFALAKYGCCCCIEEHSWIAALSMTGYADEALQREPMMFQSWGGGTECQGSMHNAVLSSNASLCYRTEDPLVQTQAAMRLPHGWYYQGDTTWDRLRDARQRGVLFARKFRSDRLDSVQLLHDIRDHLWDSATT